MRKTIIIGLLTVFILSGCGKRIDPMQSREELVSIGSGNINESIEQYLEVSIPESTISGSILVTGENINIYSSGKHLVYQNLFSILIPNNLISRSFLENKTTKKHNILNLVGVSEFPENINIYFEDIPQRRTKQTNKEKCSLERYTEYVKEKKISEKQYGEQKVYITNIKFSGFNRTWNQGDICFIQKDKIYIISISQFEKNEIQKVIDSFKFIK